MSSGQNVLDSSNLLYGLLTSRTYHCAACAVYTFTAKSAPNVCGNFTYL